MSILEITHVQIKGAVLISGVLHLFVDHSGSKHGQFTGKKDVIEVLRKHIWLVFLI